MRRRDGGVTSSTGETLLGNSADEGFPEANITVAIESVVDESRPICAGVLLTPTVVLTARECVRPSWAGHWPTVRVGTSFSAGIRYFSARRALIQPGASPGSSGSVDSNGQLALIHLDPRKPVLVEALTPHAHLVSPFEIGPGPDNSWVYENVGMSGWLGPDIPPPHDRRMSAVFASLPLISNTDFVGGAGKPFWLRNVSGSGQKLSRQDVDLGGPLFVQSASKERQVFGIAIQIGATPGQVPSGACPAAATACDVWVDLTAEVNARWIRNNVEIPLVTEGPGKNSSWFDMHSRSIVRSNGTPDWWYGEVDYTGPCRTSRDADCDH